MGVYKSWQSKDIQSTKTHDWQSEYDYDDSSQLTQRYAANVCKRTKQTKHIMYNLYPT